jgi:putative inorganic carbon (HCO3(-)) transporter
MSDRGLGAVSAISTKLGGAPGVVLVGILGIGLLGLAILAVTRVRPSLLVTITLLLTVFSGEWKYIHIPFGLDHVTTAMAIAAAIYRVKSPRHPERFVLRPVHLLFGLTLIYTIISALWSGTLTNRDDLFKIVDSIGFVPYMLFALAPVVFATRRDREILLGGLFVLGIYLGIGALGETLHVHAIVVPSYINNPSIGDHASRVRGPFLEASPEGFALFGTGFAAVWVALRAGRLRLRALAGVVVLFCLIGTFGTVTRAVWIGCALSAVLAMVITPKVRRYTIPGVLGIAVVILLSLLLIPGLSSHASSRADEKRPVWDRFNSDRAALRMFESHPLVGEGFGTFATKGFAFYQQANSYPITFVTAVHNVYLGRFAELGFLGGGLWLLSLLLALAYAMKGPRSGDLVYWRVFAAAVLLNYAINAAFVPLDYAMPNALVWLLLGISAIPVMAARAPAEVVTPGSLPRFELDPREPAAVAS